MDIDAVAHSIFGFGALLFLYKVKRRTNTPFKVLLSLNPRNNISSVKLTLGELLLVSVVFILPLVLLAVSAGIV